MNGTSWLSTRLINTLGILNLCDSLSRSNKAFRLAILDALVLLFYGFSHELYRPGIKHKGTPDMSKAFSFLPAVVFILLSFNPSAALADICCRNYNTACTDNNLQGGTHCTGDAQGYHADVESCTSADNLFCPLGACCTGDGCIDNVTQQTCKDTYGSDILGPGTTCDDLGIAENPACVENEPTVACCLYQHPTSHICSDLSAGDCETQGGTPIGSDCADTANLEPCPSLPATIACCIDEDQDGINDTCSDLGEAACGDAGGNNIGSACSDADVGACPATVTPTGACCMPDGSCLGGYTSNECLSANGAYAGDNVACPGGSSSMSQAVASCAALLGACCMPNGDCQNNLTEGTCNERNGSFGGLNTICDDPTIEARNEIICPVLGACCSPDGCVDTTEENCSLENGNQFDSTALCDEITDSNGLCVSTEPTIACCVGDQCLDITDRKCEELGGVAVGIDCQQDHIQCPVVAIGACCTPEGDCVDGKQEADCIQAYGDTSYQGDGTNCRQLDIECTESPDLIACCSGDECLDIPFDECQRIRGVVVGESCDQDHVICPVVQVGACCTEEGCTDGMLEADCTQLHGDNAYQGDGTHCRDSNVQCEEISFTKACCLPSGICVNALPEECERVQGTIVGEDCANDDIICEGPQGACCTNNGFAGPGCISDQTLEECRALDGIYLGDNAMCTDDVDCGQYFNNEPTGGCCLPDGTCEDNHTFKDCVTELQGSWLGENVTCEQADDCEVPTSACCLDDGCIETTAENCHFLGGTAVGDDITDCVPGLCLEALGSCCTASGCLNLTETACIQRNGTFDPDSSHCVNLDSDFCPTSVGACCTASGCLELIEEFCIDENGTYYGNGVSCTDADIDCIDSEGACCIDGQCLSLTSSACETLGGQFYGVNVNCDDPDIVCEALPIGACCGGQNTAPCFNAEEGKCLSQGGQWFPDVSCDDTDPVFQCPVIVACCLPQGDCVEVELERCEEMGGVNAGEQCEGPGDAVVICPDTTVPQGGCCLPNGDCTYMGAEACADVSGTWLGEDEPCPEDATPSGGTGNIISTGNDLYNIGEFNELPLVPILWPHDNGISDPVMMYEWMAANEPTSPFGKYYFQLDPAWNTSPLNQTAPNWDCAGEIGTKLNRLVRIKLNSQLEDPDLQLADFYSFQDLLNALLASPYYASELTPQSGMSEVNSAIAYVNADGVTVNPWQWGYEHAEGCFTYENPDIVMCPLAEDGACCLPSGECTQLSEEACADITGEWLGSGEPCPDTLPVGATNFVSTGWDINSIGSYNFLNPVPTLWNPETTSVMDYVQAISLAEPATPFAHYYFEDADSQAPSQDDVPYWCAGNNGNRLHNIWYIRLEDTLEDPALRWTEYHSFADLLNALSYSPYYAAELSTNADWLKVNDAISYVVENGMIHPFVIVGRPGLQCYEEVSVTEGACPAPIACCLVGGCYQLSEHACEERGGVVVGDDCNDDDIVCGDGNNNGDQPGACCSEGACLNVDAETCSITYQGIYYNDAAQCLDECIPVQGACCLNNGSCIDATEDGCDDNNGEWLGPDTDCQSLANSNTGGVVSTGWDVYETGNFGSIITLAPYGGAPTSQGDHLQWMSLNEPQSDLNKYYYQGFFPANQTAGGNWQCAGEQGNRLEKWYAIQIGDSLDATLSQTTYWTFADLRNAMIGSSAYPSVNAYSTYFEVRDALQLGNAGAEVFSVFGQIAMHCFKYQDDTSQCPVKDACCIDGVCSDLTTEECEAQGGTVVGDDCDDPDIVCESTDVPCCINGTCIVIDETECLASGGALAGAGCETDNICPQPTGACCINDTCVDGYDAVKCEQEGGSYYGDGSDCTDPNIVCGGGDKGGCCMSDGSCVDTSYGDCAENGGNYLGDGVLCSEQTDAGLCPTPTIGACCIDGQCSETTAEKCHYFGGQYFGDGADCVPGLCDSNNGLGGCCVQGSCVEPVSEASCENHSGDFYPDGCDEEICGGVHRGACCVDGTCSVLYESDCEALGGSYLGDDVPCTADTQCPGTPGACCMPDGSCQEEEREPCIDMGGLYLGADCQNAQCPTPSGACCMPDGNCAQMPEDECKHLLGSYQGHGTDCVDVQCTALDGGCGDENAGSSGDDSLGACCTDSACVETTSDECTEGGGLWAGANSTCDEEDICKLGTSTPVEPGGVSCSSSGQPPFFIFGFLILFGLFRRRSK